MITAHQLYNYIIDHASTYGMKPLRMLRFYVIMTSQRELFPHLTADMRRFKKLPQIYRDQNEPGSQHSRDRAESTGSSGDSQDLWEERSSEAGAVSAPSDGNEFYPLTRGRPGSQGLVYSSPLFPLLNNEVASARKQIQASVEQAMGHCRRDNLWRRLFHGDHMALDKLKLARLSFTELEELLQAVQSHSVGDIDPQLVRLFTIKLVTTTKIKSDVPPYFVVVDFIQYLLAHRETVTKFTLP
ncbi:hypothetical protein XENOCAPTIV_010560 [Xenoophorus captivus]|uniref:Uncharacterized protein n=1 Tax=Xenoophorus captivus TaxID=1517983 RepID=A0ABV0RHZ6_9TELE